MLDCIPLSLSFATYYYLVEKFQLWRRKAISLTDARITAQKRTSCNTPSHKLDRNHLAVTRQEFSVTQSTYEVSSDSCSNSMLSNYIGFHYIHIHYIHHVLIEVGKKLTGFLTVTTQHSVIQFQQTEHVLAIH